MNLSELMYSELMELALCIRPQDDPMNKLIEKELLQRQIKPMTEAQYREGSRILWAGKWKKVSNTLTDAIIEFFDSSVLMELNDRSWMDISGNSWE